ncbi:MAG: aminotransferase class IV [Urechidicola sp.]|nr:aminotransferase class IV [Urechidicola sp.]
MINFNGDLISNDQPIFTISNRAFNYGDGIFETLKIVDYKIVFFEDHYFRLMASMRMLRMEIPSYFTLEFLKGEIEKTVAASNISENVRIRVSVFRKDGGFYNPNSNEVDYVIVAQKLFILNREYYKVDLFKDYYLNSGLLSTIKTTNRMLNVVASIYADENDLDTCLLINEKKYIVEAIHGNIFLVFGNTLITPAITEGCIKGIVRKKIIQITQKHPELIIEEREVSPFEIIKADELFITNSIIDIQAVSQYRKKKFANTIANKISELLKNEYP